jgi:exocyst complex component 4
MRSSVEQLQGCAPDERTEFITKGNQQLLEMVHDFNIEEMDLVLERRALSGLCLLVTSTTWLATKLQQLRYVSAQATDASRRHSERFEKQQRRWTLITSNQQSEPEQVFLPLTEETAAAFDGVYKSYLELSGEVLRMIHLEIRCHVIYYTRKSMDRPFLLEQDINEPDPEVVALNADLVGFDEDLTTHLQAPQQEFIVRGLASLLDTTILSLSANIQSMNMSGCSRLQLNVLVLQQNLKNVEVDAQLRRSALYYDLFGSGPDAVIAEAKRTGKKCEFTYDEMKQLLELCYSEKKKSERREEVVAAERGLADRLLQLSEFLW